MWCAIPVYCMLSVVDSCSEGTTAADVLLTRTTFLYIKYICSIKHFACILELRVHTHFLKKLSIPNINVRASAKKAIKPRRTPTMTPELLDVGASAAMQ